MKQLNCLAKGWVEIPALLLLVGLWLLLDEFAPPAQAPGVVLLVAQVPLFQWFQVQQISSCELCSASYCCH